MASSTAGSAAISIPFTFQACSSPTLSDPSASTSPLLSKGGSPLTVLCPPRSQRVRCLLRLTRPCRLTRVIVRNAGSAFLAVRLNERCGATLAGSSGWSELVPEQQLCAADVWRDGCQLRPLPPALVRVHTFPSAVMRGSFSPQLADCTAAALCVEVRGVEDEWSRETMVGLSWLEVFGVPVD